MNARTPKKIKAIMRSPVRAAPAPNQSLFHSLAAKALYFCPLCRMAGLLEIEETAGSVSPGS
jgi:hypothetical protein